MYSSNRVEQHNPCIYKINQRQYFPISLLTSNEQLYRQKQRPVMLTRSSFAIPLLFSVSTICAMAMVHSATGLEVIDDLQRTISINSPAKRIVSLAPHLTELVHSAQAGKQLVGVSRHCNYPQSVKKLPAVSDYTTINYELLTQLEPDLVLVWNAGLKNTTLHKLTTLYNNVYVSNPLDFDDIAENLREISILAGHAKATQQTVTHFLRDINDLAIRYTQTTPVKTLYLLWHTPPMTVSNTHWISKVINLCNGTNVFADAITDIIKLNRESLQLTPMDVVVHSLSDYSTQPDKLAKVLSLPKKLPIFYIQGDLIQRPSLRITQSAAKLCQIINHQKGH